MKNHCIIKGKKISLKQLAAYSRKFTVKNNTISSKLKTVKIDKDTEVKVIEQNGVMYHHAGWKGIFKSLGIAGNLYTVSEKPDNLGLHFHLVEPISWKNERHKQPKNLRKKRKAWDKWIGFDSATPEDVKLPYGKHIVYPATKSEFPDYTLPKMNKIEYCEKLVEHKLARWEHKHPQPCPNDDLFKVEYQTQWYADRDAAKERFRDFVVSIYDPLSLTGRFVVAKENSATYQEEEVAKIKDINGEGHRVNELPKDSKLMKKAQKITNETKRKRPNLIATNLKDHKRQKGRIVLPEAA